MILLPSLLAVPSLVSAQDKPAIVVHTFTAAPGQPWPYDLKQMAAQTVAELQRKDEKRFEVFEHTDTIRAAFWGNGYADSVGQLAQPFADKIADRLAEAKL
jgi:hypothetical protein